MIGSDTVGQALIAVHVSHAAAVRLLAYLGNYSSPSASAGVLFFVVGHLLGTTLLGIALCALARCLL